MVFRFKEGGSWFLNGRQYWAVRECINAEDSSINPDYLLVIKRDEETAWSFKENIYSVRDEKFLFETWYDSVELGKIREGKYFYVSYMWRDENGKKKRIINKASIDNGKLAGEWMDIKDFDK